MRVEDAKKVAKKEGVKESSLSEFIDEQVPAFASAVASYLNTSLEYEDIARALIEHARQYGGCMSCVHSRPYKRMLDERLEQGKNIRPADIWYARTCPLGLSQERCGSAYKPIV